MTGSACVVGQLDAAVVEKAIKPAGVPACSRLAWPPRLMTRIIYDALDSKFALDRLRYGTDGEDVLAAVLGKALGSRIALPRMELMEQGQAASRRPERRISYGRPAVTAYGRCRSVDGGDNSLAQ
jgi:hypothetical protein